MFFKHSITIAAVCSCAVIGYEVFSRRSEMSQIINNKTEIIFGRSLQENILHSQKTRVGSDDIDTAMDESLDTIEARHLLNAEKAAKKAAKRRIRSPSFSDELRMKGPTYGALTCPLEMSMFSNFNRAIGDFTGTFITTAMESMKFSNDHKATERVRSVEKSGSLRGRKIIFLGDSLTRHLFIAMGCLSSGITANRVAWAPWVKVHPNDRESGGFSGYNAGRAKLLGGGDLIYYHIARNLMTPPSYITPLINNIFERYSWINSCRRREPFYIHPSIISFGENEIKLSKKDVVVLNAGIYRGVRPVLMKMMKDLLDCVEDARKEGTASEDWPQFFYFITPQTSQSSLSSPYANKCVDMNGPGFQKEDRNVFPKLVGSILGDDLNWNSFARYLVGYSDCIHYTQMGVHDVVAAELAERIQGLDSDSGSTTPVSSPSAASPVKSPSGKTKKTKKSKANGSKCGKCKGMDNAECKRSRCCIWKKKKMKCKKKNKRRTRI